MAEDDEELDDFEDEEEREELVEDDEISAAEQGFMEGESGGGKNAKCANCGTILIGEKKVVEAEVNGEKHFFCSDRCAKKYVDKHEIA